MQVTVRYSTLHLWYRSLNPTAQGGIQKSKGFNKRRVPSNIEEAPPLKLFNIIDKEGCTVEAEGYTYCSQHHRTSSQYTLISDMP